MKQVTPHPLLDNIEDLRIFDYNHSVWFVGSKRDDATNTFWETFLCEFDKKCDSIKKIHHTFRVEKDHIKNIVPLVSTSNNGLYVIDINKADVYEYDYSKNIKKFKLDMSLQKTLFPQSELCGSTQFVDLHENKNTYGGVVHDLYIVLGQRYYLHHWVEIDIKEWKLVYMSKPFILANFGIEFATGITRTNDSNDHFKIFFGLKNSCNFSTTCTLQELRQGGTVRGPVL